MRQPKQPNAAASAAGGIKIKSSENLARDKKFIVCPKMSFETRPSRRRRHLALTIEKYIGPASDVFGIRFCLFPILDNILSRDPCRKMYFFKGRTDSFERDEWIVL